MIIQDRIYGEFDIKEPVLTELIKSKPVQRLKKISQFGIPNQYYFLKGYSRYEHSVGVMLLLRKLGASLDEQIAGLLHDVSHYAFSHVADWVFDNIEDEDHQDKILTDFIGKSGIKPILKKYGFDYKIISNLSRYKILEREIPELCVDRIDYVLREFEFWSNREKLNYCLNNLTVIDNRTVFKNKKAAQIFGRYFLKCQIKHWSSIQAMTGYYFLSNLLKKSLEKNIIKLDDFLDFEEIIIRKLEKSKDPEIIEMMKILATQQYINHKIDENIKKKFRYADPKFIQNNKIFTLSRVDKQFANLIEKYRLLNRN